MRLLRCRCGCRIYSRCRNNWILLLAACISCFTNSLQYALNNKIRHALRIFIRKIWSELRWAMRRFARSYVCKKTTSSSDGLMWAGKPEPQVPRWLVEPRYFCTIYYNSFSKKRYVKPQNRCEGRPDGVSAYAPMTFFFSRVESHSLGGIGLRL